MKEGTPKTATRVPLAAPRSAQLASASRTAGTTPTPMPSRLTTAMPAQAATAPTDRSNSPTTMTKVAAAATKARVAICWVTLSRLAGVAKASGRSKAQIAERQEERGVGKEGGRTGKNR